MARDQIAQALNKQDEKRSTILKAHKLIVCQVTYYFSSISGTQQNQSRHAWLDLYHDWKHCVSTSRWGRGKGRGSTRQQWNLDVTRDQGTGKICCYDEVSLYRGSFSYILLLLTKKIFRNTEDFTCPCVAGAGLFFRAKERREAPAAETLVFHLRPQFNNLTALHQQTNRLTIWNWHRIASVAVSVELGRQHPGGAI